MNGVIQTGFTGGAILTSQQAGESDADWQNRHLRAVGNGIPVTTTSLLTSWTCNGTTESVTVTRNTGESLQDFLDRWRDEVKDQFAQCPPE